jgi:dTDP-4-dehydrorhamnose reductase
MRVLVTGGSGQLARAIEATWTGHECLLLGRADLDLGEAGSIAAALDRHRPEVVVNAGAFTQVDRCEAQPDLAWRINGEAVGHLAEGCARHGALLLQVSTDYVFDGVGTRPYREQDPTAPRSVYGRSKLEGERLARFAPRHLIVRTGWLYDAWGRNFLQTMLHSGLEGRKIKVVDDQTGTPTSCRALARQLEVAVQEGWQGLVHASCHGECTWYGFAREIFRQRALVADLSPCTTAEYPMPAPRPAYSVLSGEHRAEQGTDVMPPWRDALAEVLASEGA